MLILLTLVWGAIIEPYLIDVEQETAAIPNLPDGWQGSRIGVIGDFQLGMWGDNEATVGKAVQRLVELRPAAVLLLGDFIYHALETRENEVQKVVQILQPLRDAGIPVYAVLGNHDYQVNEAAEAPNEDLARRLEQELEAIGVRVLHNEIAELAAQSAGTPSLFLVGIDAHQPRMDDPYQALSNLSPDAPRLVMMHNPASFEKIPAGVAPVAVAGHTHGGQVRIPFLPEWSYLTFLQSEPVHADGWISDYGQANNHLYVNRGIGFSKVPIRINCPPEVTVFTLEKAK